MSRRLQLRSRGRHVVVAGLQSLSLYNVGAEAIAAETAPSSQLTNMKMLLLFCCLSGEVGGAAWSCNWNTGVGVTAGAAAEAGVAEVWMSCSLSYAGATIDE